MTNIRFLQIEPTTRCNYTCGFCAGRHMAQIDLDIDIYKQLIDSVSELRHIELQGEGEALLHPHFFDMIHYARLRFPEVKVSFITNGSFFTQGIIANILAAAIDSLLISIESADETEFQRIRGGKLSRVKRGIKELITQKQATNSKMSVGFAVTVLKNTLSQINQIGALYQELSMDGGITAQPLQAMECYSKHYTEELQQNIPTGKDRVAMSQLIASDRATSEAMQAFGQTTHFYSDLYTSTPPKTPTCPWLENGLYLSAEGIASSCAFIKNTERDGLAVLNNNLASILEKRHSLLKTLKSGATPDQCNGCQTARRIQHQLRNTAT